MILADTSVVIDFLRTGDTTLLQTIVNEPAAICGITRAEVLHGVRNPSDRQRCMAALSMFPQVPIPDPLWDAVGDQMALLRAAGVTVPFTDVAIAVLAIANNLPLWTRDAHFAAIQGVVPTLKLFQQT